jgi:hypothetical protein
MFRGVVPRGKNQKKRGFGVDDRWPYPTSQTMQRQTGSRVKTLPVPGTPPTAPDSTKDKTGKEKSIEPSRACKVDPRRKD